MASLFGIRTPITIVLILINVVFFFVQPKTSGFSIDTSDPFNAFLQFTPATALEMPWTFITSTFMHADLTHLAFNMFALFIFGLFLESRVRPHTFLAVYFLAGVVGNVGYMLTASDSTVPGVGASGAIYGIMGVLGAIAPRVPIYMMLIPIPIPMFIAVILYGIIEFLGFFAPGNIARGAHLGGLFLGLLYGWWLRRRHASRHEPVRIRYTY